MRLLTRWLLVLALSFSIGLSGSLLQSAAWIGMFVSFAGETSLVKSITMTLDGEHPCQLCKAVQRTENSGKKPNTGHDVVRFDLAEPEQDSYFFDPPVTLMAGVVVCGDGRSLMGPPLPPPKAV